MTTSTPAAAPTVTLAGPGPWERRVHVEHVWGTVVTFDLRAASFADDYDDVLAAAVAYLHQVDAWFSTYRLDTPIALLRNGLMPLEVAPRVVREVLDACAFARELTGGAFDPWAVAGGVDPSGYVKGWAAGQVADRLVRAGIPNVAVDAAGDIACRGAQAPGEPWTIGVLNPYDTQQIVEVVHIGDGAVATSGLYERGAHIVDPATGDHTVWYDSATIVGPDAGLADALATAALVTGPAAAAWFARLPGWSVYFIKDGQASFFGPAFEGRREGATGSGQSDG
ncbi:MAG TPA: FAD:protein FMN transferase [Jatrophihabitans sp.]|uniref:FAD:protein FMN transferase n=1 Tax=Jatrophihabitans sp. TaxID=1932789 RepID=UPI002E02AC07|nr:FAD:protein FMN transferase [Jatrophihabitans sp.]